MPAAMPVPAHSTPVCKQPLAPLPQGVTRCRHAGPATTLEDCAAVRLELHKPDGRGTLAWILWREPTHKAVRVRPLTAARITQLRPGDRVEVAGLEYTVAGLEVWR